MGAEGKSLLVWKPKENLGFSLDYNSFDYELLPTQLPTIIVKLYAWKGDAC